ncbi:MAG: IS607 family transposase [Deltaproteobacteria bacterium]|nr:IS607 family transposase [Deltaproteobacteria bacterium]
MKLSDWAKQQGISYRTAWRWFRQGRLPCRAEQMPSGTILVYPDEETQTDEAVVIYARVSSSNQRGDLQRQVERLVTYANARGWRIADIVTEIGSGLNGRRKKLLKLLADPNVRHILVEHRDRLARFGVEFIEAALSASGRKLTVVDETEFKDDLWQDFVDLVTSMAVRIYGRRGARNRAQRALEALRHGDDNLKE